MLDNYKSSEVTESTQLWRMRWFFARLFAAALLLSILASIIIAVITKNPLPALVPTPLLLSMRPLIRWLFPRRTIQQKTGILTE
jgi:hypothetical protein